MSFISKLHRSFTLKSSVLCVGLDPDVNRIPAYIMERSSTASAAVVDFCRIIIEETSGNAIAYKPNLAFFESLGADGLDVFSHIVAMVPDDSIVIADAKRGDIGNTAGKYRDAFFSAFGCDSVTLSPFMGFETITPYLTDAKHGVFVLVLTSNPGAEDFMLRPFNGFDTMSEYVASTLSDLDKKFPGHAGMVVGATQAGHLRSVISKYPGATLLIPGIGSQGGDVDELTASLTSHRGIPIINISRGILYGDNDSSPNDDNEFRTQIRQRTAQFQTVLRPLVHQVASNIRSN